MKYAHSYVIGAALMATACPLAAQAQEKQDMNARKDKTDDPAVFRLSTGVTYSVGDYGDTRDTKVIAAPLSVKVTKGPFSLRVSSAFVRISGPGSLIDTPQGRDVGFGGGDSGSSNSGPGSSNSGSGSSGSGGSNSGSGSSGSGSSGSGGSSSGGTDIVPGSTFPSSKRSGFGDVSVTAAYSLDLGNDFYADISGKVKLPTASTAKRLGTGKVDVTTGLDLVKDIGNVSVYVGGRRRFNGSSTAPPLRDVWGFGGGASLRASKSVSLGVDYDWQQSSSLGNGPSSEITGWSSFRLGGGVSLTVFGSTGFTANSADFSGGATIGFRF